MIESFRLTAETFDVEARGWDARYAKILQVQMCAKYIVACSIERPDDEMVYDLYTPYIAQITRLSEEVLKFESEGGKFCFDDRFVMSLWMTGMKCRDWGVRESVLNVLRKYPKREGLWDSAFSAEVIQWVRDLEERGGEASGRVEEWKRVVGARWRVIWRGGPC